MRYRPLRHNSEFGRVYARGKAYVDPALVLYVLKTRAKQTRVGLTALRPPRRAALKAARTPRQPDAAGLTAAIRQSGSCGPWHGGH